MSGINETILTVQHESCECKFGLNESVCNSKSKWNPNECCGEVFRTLPNIQDGLSAVNYICKTLHLRYLTGF